MDPGPAAPAPPPVTLYERARAANEATFTRPGIAALAGHIHASDELGAALDKAIARGDGGTAAALILAGLVAGHAPTSEQVARALPLAPSVKIMTWLIGSAPGDRGDLLLDLVEAHGQDSIHRATALLLCAAHFEGKPTPPRLCTAMRLFARRHLDVTAGAVLGAAARLVDDANVQEVVGRWIDLASPRIAADLLGKLREDLENPLGQPEAPAQKVLSGFTVRRVMPKVGRNDPCPCGSGQKYKRCCEGKAEDRLADPSPVAGVTMTEYLAAPYRYMSVAEFGRLDVMTLLALEPADLPTAYLLVAARMLSSGHHFAGAESAFDELARRPDFPTERGSLDQHRADLVGFALSARAYDVARRQAALIQEPGAIEYARLDLELLEPGPQTLSRIADEILEGLRGTKPQALIELAFPLLRLYPALGILVARSALDPTRGLDTEELLTQIEEARDRLQLPPGDIAADLYERSLVSEYVRLESEASAEALARGAKMVAEATGQRAKLEEASRNVAALERRLQDTQAELARASAAPAAPPAGSVGRPRIEPAAPPAADIKRLRAKVEELKGLVTEGQKERGALRGALAEATQRLEQAASSRDAQGTRADEADTHPDEIDAAPPRRTGVLVPVLGAASEGLRDAPPAVARLALELVAGLAVGDESSWRGCKRIRSVADLWSARAGIHHRFLFRIDSPAHQLVAVALIHRRELESVLKRLA